MIQRLIVGGVLLAALIPFWMHGQQLGFTIASDSSGYAMSAGSSLAYTLIAVLLLIVYLIVVQIKPSSSREFERASIWVRAGAFLADVWAVTLMLGGVAALVALSIEGLRTGDLRWQIQRNYSTPTDSVLPLLIFLMMGVALFYFVLPLLRCGHSIGSWLFRLSVVGPDQLPIALPVRLAFRRTYREFIGLTHPFRTFKECDERGWTWYDRETGMTVMHY